MGQANLMASDLEMYNEELDTPCAVRSSNLGQELGKFNMLCFLGVFMYGTYCLCYVFTTCIIILVSIVSYTLGQVSNIFSDKTGKCTGVCALLHIRYLYTCICMYSYERHSNEE